MVQLAQRDIPNNFDSKKAELDIYKIWEASGFFKPENMEAFLKENNHEVNKPFVMTLPPPNANGDLHIGHTTGYSFMDAMARYKRMTGHPALLIAGKDHAGIQTEAVYTRKLREENIVKQDLGRDEFYKRCYKFCTTQAKNAREQEKRVGLSADWDREFFTLDPNLTEIVYETFFQLYEDGLVYRDKRIINQCSHCGTALADVDTYHKEMRGIFAYIIYPFVDEDDRKLAKEKFGVEGITVATTRPETMLGDSAVAVNPDDDRYKEFIGKKLMLPFVNREIPVIADKDVTIEDGAGALKVTPAHSPIDFEIGKRHKLEVINVIDEEGKMTGDIPEEFIGMETVECSKALIGKLDEMGLLVKIENIKHDVSVCERCDTPIQPIISYQWFIDTKPLAKMALDMLESRETVVMPEGQMNALKHFYRNIEPWCISRQLWWSHAMPIWYSGSRELHDWLKDNDSDADADGNTSSDNKDVKGTKASKTWKDYEKETGKKVNGSGKVFVQVDKPEKDDNWDGDSVDLVFEKETDVFDTWFSSGQWPFSTLMALDKMEKHEGEFFKQFYPTNTMVHARDILYWWTGRMMMLSTYKTKKLAELKGKENGFEIDKITAPFNTVFLTGMILDEKGKKMSKSRGNTVSPTDIMDKYGVDALRLWYYSDALPGANAPLQEEKIKGNRFFVNKIWNASRFVMLNIHDEEIAGVVEAISKGEFAGKRVEATKEHIEDIKNYLEDHKYHLGVEAIREFFWHQFADKWIEEIKAVVKDLEVGDEVRIKSLAELVWILKESLKIMHPFMPYITESVWQELKKIGLVDGLVMVYYRILYI